MFRKRGAMQICKFDFWISHFNVTRPPCVFFFIEVKTRHEHLFGQPTIRGFERELLQRITIQPPTTRCQAAKQEYTRAPLHHPIHPYSFSPFRSSSTINQIPFCWWIPFDFTARRDGVSKKRHSILAQVIRYPVFAARARATCHPIQRKRSNIFEGTIHP